MEECELCDNAEWRPGIASIVDGNGQTAAAFDSESEAAQQSVPVGEKWLTEAKNYEKNVLSTRR